MRCVSAERLKSAPIRRTASATQSRSIAEPPLSLVSTFAGASLKINW
jgi:hypothetical protein